ncbi:MAG: pitrilysin family protein [bacterium]|nr:pitrilysin family protein [bacterium]
MIKPSDSGVIKRTLSNGLTVLVKEDHSSPVVAVNVWFGVGSVNETEEANGLAHFQEHMVFKGTERHGVGEIANIVKSAGGNLNAATSYSYTMYYIVLPSKAFSLALDIQADAMMNSTFLPEEFQKERLVVIDEARMYDDTPDSYTFYRTMELGYKVHNYRRPIAGYEKIVREFTRDQLVEFYDQHYRPENATLVVVGDVKFDDAMKDIEKIYGGWENRETTVLDSPAEPKQEEFRFKTFRGSIDHAYVGAGFHVPSIIDDDYPALEMLATLLSSGRSSRLYRRVIEEERLATTVGAELLAEKWPGYFMFFASMEADKWERARDVIFSELARFQDEPVEEAELLKARRQMEKSMYSSLETVEGQASNLGYYQLLGDYELAERHREAIRRVTPEEVMYVAGKYFCVSNCTIVSYLPEDAAVKDPVLEDVRAALSVILPADENAIDVQVPVDRASINVTTGRSARKTTGGEKPVMRLSTLDNGLRVLVKHRPSVPVVSVLTLFQGGTRLETTNKSGLATLATRAQLKGTKKYSAEDVIGTIEGLGGSIESFSSFDVTGAYINMLTEHLDAALPVYRDVIREPGYDGDRVEQEKSKLLKELVKRHDHPVHYSIDALFDKVYGRHPYAHPYRQDESNLAGLTNQDCLDWHSRVLVPENMVMVFVGDIAEERAREIAQDIAGDMESGPTPVQEIPAPDKTATPGLVELRRKNLKQAVGLVGYLAPPMMTDESLSLTVLNGIMTGLGGRLFVELRDKRSLGYMAGSNYMPLKDGSIFYAYSNPGAEGIDEAIDVILTELDRVTREDVTNTELSRAKEWLIGTQTMSMQRNLSQATEYGIYEALGFGFQRVDSVRERIQSVSRESIRRAAGAVFTAEGAIVKLLASIDEELAKE